MNLSGINRSPYTMLTYMATLASLIFEEYLFELTVPLNREFPVRWIYAFPEMIVWLRDDLPKLEPGRLNASEAPTEQLDNIFYKWISGKSVRYDKIFKDLMPVAAEVWEMKTADLRVFGWMCQPRKFIAVFADYADDYKGFNRTKSYEKAIRKVLRAREGLPLDEPKFVGGVFDDLV